MVLVGGYHVRHSGKVLGLLFHVALLMLYGGDFLIELRTTHFNPCNSSLPSEVLEQVRISTAPGTHG